MLQAGEWSKRRKGQSTLEYILVMAAILVAVIVAANGLIAPSVNTTMSNSKGVIDGAVNLVKGRLGL